MGLWESVRTSAAEIRAHKLRSLLTLAGIILGTTSMVVMVSVIGGAAISVQKGLSDLGFDGVMFVTTQAPRERLEKKKQGYSRGLRSADLRFIDEGKELLEGAAPVVFSRESALVNGRNLTLNVEGVTPAYSAIRNRTVRDGRYIVDRDVEELAPVCVIGQKLKEDVYGHEEALGREIVMRGLRLRIVGVLRSLGTDQVNDDEMAKDNSKVYLPLSTMQKHFFGTDAVMAYAFKVKDVERLKDGQKEAEALLRRGHRGITDFRVENIGEEMLRIRREVDKLISNWTVVLASIAGISLLVGGIGIFSVMQISISERVYEIGLRKSIGASDGAIFGQFLIESVSLSLVGGLLGAGLGYAITMLAGQAFEDGLSVSPVGLLMAAGFAIVIGLSAGVYPALRASRLAPVDALRAL
ncbi:MAG TPA: ABC transporter permease [Vicinamibacteria bacterium]|nr:ABC transporter permease [Vicinamibacteria bacterium]